ncbi:hypothetical protein B0A55_08851 [Friedmanniomyces simplex]|uniref:Paf1 complex protein n=1 Tax=Friedmanniomyces simplex TaxID=329884 RepID=A0A4U0WZ34_9PEZI|nr:hypothetical protein B0A55_08851 [Friedmanniomyces simplex]
MSSAQRPPGVVHQDYIARIRYSNTLPPPPNPPKLLDIPGTGLAGGQYTSAGYASKLAREQPMNIEADAELGMAIDMIGVPGIFNGDERAILARPGAQLHPADKALLKPLSALGKANATGSGVSFLRRTEYTASQGPQHFASNTSKDMMRLRNDPKRRKLNTVDKEDPVNIIRNIVKGFDIAYPGDAYKGDDSTTNIRGAAVTDADAKAWTHPKHPTKPGLQLLDSYPVLPDLDALCTAGAFVVAKFQSNPLAGDTYDSRLDTAILRPIEDPRTQAIHQRKLDDWKASNQAKPEPTVEYDYEYFVVPDTATAAAAVHNSKRTFDVHDAENKDPDLYTDDLPDGSRGFKYERLRTYETYNQHGHPQNHYNDSVALALHDPEMELGGGEGEEEQHDERRSAAKAAYYYPIVQRTALRPKRKVVRQTLVTMPEEDRVDVIYLRVRGYEDEEREKVFEKQAELDPGLRGEGEGGGEGGA